ncbi:MAG: type II toxin-antitoxin system PemK/MazF family toxin [Deltaproteobacteria bacterium]|nr:MAG: type II toxin-antitoxin system PemK/MazF family toxin [Deltaproteobacteria bacterium]
MRRGELWWASLPEPSGSMPGFRRPLVIVQSNDFNRSRIRTVLAAVMTSNLRLANAPGNVLLPAKSTGLRKDSVVNVSQLITVNKSFLTEKIGRLTDKQRQAVDDGLRLVLAL